MTKEELLKLAFQAKENSYALYSDFPVGACVLCDDGKYFFGVNIENASYGLTNCAERSAIFAAYSQGYRKDNIKALAIVSDGKTIAYPCGACRQVLNELLNKDTPIYLANATEEITTSINEILPYAFGSEDLNV